MHVPAFDNAFLRALPGDPEARVFPRQVTAAMWSPVAPTPVLAPRLLAHSREMAAELGFSEADLASPEFARVFGGNALLPGMQPFATNYGGHQFGHWAGQLGDGRAISLGEAVLQDGQRRELQLKGAGPTPYSRSADGRAVLRSSLREFVCSEAMHHLGIPTTRALSLVGTGEGVVRDMFYDGHPELEPGAIVCRVAPSFLRFGHFELPAMRGDAALLRHLVDVCIARDFPMLAGQGETLYADWFGEVCERTARLVAGWMRVGFVHGVLNTDNMSILGLTIDYGPYGWIEPYDPDWTPNTTDATGRRYRYGWQPRVAYWNLGQLARALSPLFADPEPLQAGLQRFGQAYSQAERTATAAKLGLRECRDGDVELIRDLHGLMQAHQVDMTLWFRGLADVPPEAPSLQPLEQAFYEAETRRAGEGALGHWLQRHASRVREDRQPPELRRARMEAANPVYVPRNWLLQQAIDRAHAGDMDGIAELQGVLREPYREREGCERFSARRPRWAEDRAGCAMLSCSS
ncbi:MAG: YdiU family protein [Acetobacteraceae bacterium]|nr:MAG: YdiU family protein [Acetobacteraceae bacterium]